jgi:carboxyl-terminal processing protease
MDTSRRVLAALAALLSPAPALAGWVAGEAERTIAFGFDAIVERHLQPVTAQAIALDGLRGLAEIDPQLAVALDQGRLKLSTTEKVVADFPAAPPDDTVGWARITVNAALEAAQVSASLRDADAERLYQAVFEGALGKADLFSRYAGAKEAREHRSNRSGFGGIGIKFDLIAGEARIVEVVDDGPAAKLGLKAGDVITAIDGQPAGQDRGDISARLRGAVATEVSLSLRRGSQMLQFALRRSLIVPQTVSTAVSGGIARFRITSFNQRTAYSLESQLKEVRDRLGAGLQGVVLDLRGNPGGLLDKAVAVVDLFVAEGTIISTRGRHPASANSFEAKPGDIGEDLPLVVLVDGRSASAAEIVASALQDAGRAVVIGTNSYGKGTVQTVVRLPNDGEITLTWSRFHAPSGYALHGLGVLPAICTGGATGTATQLVEAAGRGALPGKPAETLAVWRGTGIDDTELRHRLRDTCPPARRSDDKLDLEVADRLLANRAAYVRALAASAPARGLEALQTRPSPETGSH